MRWHIALAVIGLGQLGTALGDGGMVRVSQRAGPYHVVVFTAPTPPRVGLLDISVLLQEGPNGMVNPDAVITVEVVARDGSLSLPRQQAVPGGAVNQLYHVVVLDVPEPGEWEVTVTIAGPLGEEVVRFAVEVGQPLPRWTEMWFWIALPVVPILLFGLHQVFGRRKDVGGRM